MASPSTQVILLRGFLNNPERIVTLGYWSSGIFNTSAFEFYSTLADILASSTTASLAEYFPQWMNMWYNTDPASGSLFRRFLSVPQRDLLLGQFNADSILRQRIYNPRLGEPRLGWTATSQTFGRDITSVVILETNGNSITPTRCNTPYEFIYSVAPCYYVEDDSTILYFRNLCNNHISTVGNGSVKFNSEGFIPGEDIYYSGDKTKWFILEAGSSSIDYFASTISLPITGSIYLVYGSSTLLSNIAGAKVSINGGPPTSLISFDFWTSIDELGLLFDVPRFPQEDNNSYFSRLYTIYPFSGGATQDKLVQSIGRNLNLLSFNYWDGRSTLTWQASDQIKYVWVHNLPQYDFVKTDLLYKGNGFYSGTKTDWITPYILQEGEIITAPSSGGRVFLDQNNYTDVWAEYKYLAWSTISSGENVVQLSPSSNTEASLYKVAWAKGIKINTVNKKEYKNSRLLDPSGNALPYFYELGELIKQKVPITLSYTTWNQAHWFLPSEVSPRIDFIPAAMDS